MNSLIDENPLVSVIIPVYNGSNYLRQAIDSALTQTYQHREVIVVNDGSNDGGKTENIARSYGDRIRYFYKENGGVASALNKGIKEMHGAYLSWLSHDDVYLPEKLALQIIHLSRFNKKVILYGDFEFIDKNSTYLKTVRKGNIDPRHFRYYLVTSNPIHGCTALIPKECFDKVGLFDETLKSTQDYAMWFNLAEHYDFVHISDVLIKSRFHSEQGIHNIPTHLQECNIFLEWSISKLTHDEILTSSGERSLAVGYLKIAISLTKRGFSASSHAFRMSKTCKSSSERKVLSSLKKVMFAIYYQAFQYAISRRGNKS